MTLKFLCSCDYVLTTNNKLDLPQIERIKFFFNRILSVMDSMTFPKGRPAIGIIPLGTGNDLSRSLNWGGKYRDKPLRKVLLDIAKSDVLYMDRWTLKVDLEPSLFSEDISHTDEKLVSVECGHY